MEYAITRGDPVSEADALAEAASMGFHAVAFDLVVEHDEDLHWHEFDSVTWIIDGTASARTGDDELVEVGPGCRVDAPAGFLHRNLAGPPVRVVLATNLPYAEWTHPIDKLPADHPGHRRDAAPGHDG